MAKFEAPGIKEWIAIGVWIFKKLQRFVMEKGYWWARLAYQRYFPQKSFKFSQNSNCHKYFLFNVRSLKLGHLHILDMPFLFLVSVLYHDHFFFTCMVTWPCHAKSLFVKRRTHYCRRVFYKTKVVFVDVLVHTGDVSLQNFTNKLLNWPPAITCLTKAWPLVGGKETTLL